MARGGRERGGSIPDKEWEVQARHVKRAIDCSGNSAPGPDGISYVAWVRLGVVSRSVLLGAVKDLMSAEGLNHIRNVFGRDVEGQHSFNKALIAFFLLH